MIEVYFMFEAYQGFFQQFWGKAPGLNWEKMIDLSIMPSIPLKHKCFSIILIWVIVSLFYFTFLNWEKQHGIGKKGSYFQLGMGPKFDP